MKLYIRDSETYLGKVTDRGKIVGNSLIAMDVNILYDWYCEGEL